MKRRRVLGAATGLLPAVAGCFGNEPPPSPTSSSDLATIEFELIDSDIEAERPPEVRVDDETITVRGTVRYGSSSCGTAKLAYVGYEDSQDRLDLLVIAADDSEDVSECTDDLVVTGYRIEATVDGRLRRVAATEHHVFGETYSTTTDLTDY